MGVFQSALAQDTEERTKFQSLAKACQARDAKACDAAVIMFQNQLFENQKNGKLTELGATNFLKSAKAACKYGGQQSCYIAGDTLRSGKFGLAEDLTGAYDMFDRGCTLRSRLSCFEGARFDEFGIGKDIDLILADVRYTKACDLGFTMACEQLDVIHEKTLTEAQAAIDHTANQADCNFLKKRNMPDTYGVCEKVCAYLKKRNIPDNSGACG